MSTHFSVKGVVDGELVVNGVDMKPAGVRSVTVEWVVGEHPRVQVECFCADLAAELEAANVTVVVTGDGE